MNAIANWIDEHLLHIVLIGGIVMVVLLILAAKEEIEHPCLRYETHHHVFQVIAYDHKMRPIYGFADDEVCVERRP